MEASHMAVLLQELTVGIQVYTYLRVSSIPLSPGAIFDHKDRAIPECYNLQVLDWLLTLRMEVSLIWQAPWTVMKGLYLVNRYMPFIDVTVAVFFLFSDALSEEMCGRLYLSIYSMYCFGIALASLIFTLRTWVAWGKHPYIGVSLTIFYISTWIVILVPLILYLKALTFEASKVPRLLGCIKHGPSMLFSISFSAAVVLNADRVRSPA
ncbi:hypothetical protein P691DRAFT_817017 [Macrolepiota fuliginosa MF-IS2]|uniref:DUF6533 domain-containing protein n=1 Tax=Macrolepiota fuliginosa MF-IS2 TaxID=1400762 RepID=A0A9P6BWL1_9AGAR|nr:hypothetical protein P691DRAFT_817017 [Macrolepiota fuliginosa MF-IS2]